MKAKTFFTTLNLRVIYTFLSAAIIMIGAVVAIQYAKGNYRLTQNGFIKESGLLSANSFPTGAQVLVNGKLTAATDDTLYLEPGTYEVKIIKDGYAPWQKTLQVEKELVAQTSALLFPSAPSITPLTFTGAQNVSPSPDGQKILYYTASASAQAQKGLYVLEMGGNLLPLQKSARQIATDAPSWQLAQAQFIWSPDSNQILLIAAGHQVLLSPDKKQNLLTLPDVSFSRKQILSQWEEEIYLRERQFLAQFPPEIIHSATESAHNVYLSPDKKKLLYTAQKSITLPDQILPPVPATNTQPQQRQLESGGIYVYDSKEDKNFRIGTEPEPTSQNQPLAKQLLAVDLSHPEAQTLAASPSAFKRLQAETLSQTAQRFSTYYSSLYAHAYQWLPDSGHLIYTAAENIKVMEYDAHNDTTLYSGPFAENFIYPWPDGSKVIILASFSPKAPANLYAIELTR